MRRDPTSEDPVGSSLELTFGGWDVNSSRADGKEEIGRVFRTISATR